MIGISWFFGFNIKPKERAKLLHRYGFERVMTNADKRLNKQNGTIGQQMKLFRKYHLQPSSLHMTYTREELPAFWKTGKLGDRLEKDLIRDVKVAKKYGFHSVVVHITGEYSKIGIQRLERVLDFCQKKNIYLAIENLDNQDLFLKVMENAKHPYLKFCYDAGHHNIWMRDIDILDRYGDKLTALHLHSNNGLVDQHTLSNYGTVNWEYIAQQLAERPTISLDYELLMKYCPEGMTAEDVVKQCAKDAKELESRIAFYRKSVK